MNFAQSRLYLGLANLSLWLLLSALGLLLGLGPYLDSQLAGQPVVAGIAGGLLAYLLIGLPFDWLGGYRLPLRSGRAHHSQGSWWQKWVRGALLHALLLGLMALALHGLFLWLGYWGCLGGMAIFMLLLLGLQLPLARLLAHLPSQPESHRGRMVYYLQSEDRAFTGGIVGLPGQEALVLPQYWRERFSEDMQKVLLGRRHGAILTGGHARGVGLALVWNLLLFGLALKLSPAGMATAGGIMTTSLAFTLFSGLGTLGLLAWPARAAVKEIDRWVYYHGGDADQLRASFEATGRLQDDVLTEKGGRLARWLAVPTTAERQAYLAAQQPLRGAWQASRLALYLSWAGLSLLSRATYSNIGRPELWVFLPSD